MIAKILLSVAGLDVFDYEPKVHAELKRMKNVGLVPHLGSATDRTRRRMMEMTIENLRAGLAGADLPYRVRR